MAEPEAEEPRPMWKQLLSAFVKQMILLMVISSVMKNLMPSNPSGNKTGELGGDKSSTSLSKNLFSQNQLYDVYFYLDEEGSSFNGYDDPKKLLWVLKSLKYGDWNHGPFGDGSYIFDATFPTPEVLLRNQSLFLHVFAIESGLPINPEHLNYDQDKVIYEVNKLNKFRKKVYKKTANLWTGKSEQSDEEQAKARIMDYEVLNFWHPNISINLLQDFSQWQKGAIPSPINKDIKFTKDNKYYKPVIFFNTFWNLASDYMPINRTVKELQLTITFYPFSLVKYQVYSSQKAQTEWENMMPGSNDEETGRDQIKQAILETNPILLSVTLFVSILHSVFEFLAFKNDIQFWKNRRDLVGLSVRSVLFNVLQSIIVFLYICDNETNFMVKVSVFASLLVESWKIPKVLDIQINNEAKFFGIIPKISFKDKGSYVESETKVYDEMAFKYLRWVLLPLLVGYAVYSIVYVEQKGWYSWILNVLYGYFLTFGFITMTPQLFINYKLKSVAHLPWRMLTYKFINTFIDDLFAFVIKMPLLYRLGCFRDDIIFIIYLYQRWIYRVDPTRINEYGTSGKNNTVEVVEETKKTK